MGKKIKEFEIKEAAYYKWEFIRRNSEYIEQYERYKKKLLILQNSKYIRIREGVYKEKKSGKMSLILTAPQGFTLCKFYDPAIDYFTYKMKDKDFSSSFNEDDLTMEITMNCEQYIEILKSLDGSIFLPKEEFEAKVIGGNFRINLRSKKEKILEKFENYLDKFLKKFSGKKLKDKKRTRFSNYDQYLKVYDLRILQGYSWEKIASIVYKGDTERDALDYAKRKVKRDFQRCEQLIRSYRQIR